jgi:hypothetical protein
MSSFNPLSNEELIKRALNKLDLAIAYLDSNHTSVKKEDIIDAKEATMQSLAALVELSERLNGNLPPK